MYEPARKLGHGQHKSSRFFRSVLRLLELLLAAYGAAILVIFYSPLVDFLVRPLWVPPNVQAAPAIVVLTAYVSANGILSESALRRMHAASRLYRKGFSPLIIISGGDSDSPRAQQPAKAMAEFADELGVAQSAILLEKESENTHASAANVAVLCRQRGIERVLLVTDAAHMRRAVGAFRAQHLSVSPFPADPWALHWETPEIRLKKFWGALHEYGGLLYYWWKGWI